MSRLEHAAWISTLILLCIASYAVAVHSPYGTIRHTHQLEELERRIAALEAKR